ncbi:MAG: PEP-CTERM sorting domain-containing protein [Burkholderiaceae bacterium]|nr:PEP-CTERM sorting domain-containing protein [Burkholderiaceae bacterium]
MPGEAEVEPETCALLLAGLGLVGLRVRQTRRAG